MYQMNTLKTQFERSTLLHISQTFFALYSLEFNSFRSSKREIIFVTRLKTFVVDLDMNA